jgi:hypothetical protein
LQFTLRYEFASKGRVKIVYRVITSAKEHEFKNCYISFMNCARSTPVVVIFYYRLIISGLWWVYDEERVFRV